MRCSAVAARGMSDEGGEDTQGSRRSAPGLSDANPAVASTGCMIRESAGHDLLRPARATARIG
jgi:hypothetical protein